MSNETSLFSVGEYLKGQEKDFVKIVGFDQASGQFIIYLDGAPSLSYINFFNNDTTQINFNSYIFFKYKILDFTFAYRLYPKNALKGYKIKELRHGFALEILLSPMKRGFKVITLPAKWKKRVEGRSSITIDSYFSYLRVLFRNI